MTQRIHRIVWANYNHLSRADLKLRFSKGIAQNLLNSGLGIILSCRELCQIAIRNPSAGFVTTFLGTFCGSKVDPPQLPIPISTPSMVYLPWHLSSL